MSTATQCEWCGDEMASHSNDRLRKECFQQLREYVRELEEELEELRARSHVRDVVTVPRSTPDSEVARQMVDSLKVHA